MTNLSPLDKIVRPEPFPVRSLWLRENADFTPWLAKNLDWLDVLDLGPLTLMGVEVPIPGAGRYLDILATTASGDHVAIENQYSAIDHDHLTRALAYAL